MVRFTGLFGSCQIMTRLRAEGPRQGYARIEIIIRTNVFREQLLLMMQEIGSLLLERA